ncbi:MAG: hypothetical protein JO227_22845 [Acetobacteraceae bacterium]|nr:hypothetical protein [Acetobacteraceae bacterium]
MHVIARLPFWAPRPEGSPAGEALVVALASPDPSGNDRSVLAVELRRDLGRTKLVAELAVAGLNPRVLVSPRREPGARIAHALLEVEGYLTEEDIQRQRLPAILLGAYAVPLDRAGL